jgi:DNA topoisomerase-6 subunit A
MRSRSTTNIQYDLKTKQYTLGPNQSTRTAANIRHLKPLTQTLWLASFTRKLMDSGRSSTLRDIYYQSEAFDIKFKDQSESNKIITDLETILETPREDFKVFPEEKSVIYGDITIEYTTRNYKGKSINLTISPDGITIGPSLTTAILHRPDPSKVDKVIAIESGGMFTRLVEENAHNRFKAVLIHTGGQAPRSTRRIIKRLNEELGLKVYIFTDGDPWGMHIAQVIISGSANAAHLRGLTTPDAKWIGVHATDITEYNLPSERFNDKDKKRIRELAKDPRYQEKFWKRQIKHFKKIQQKAEQQAFSRYGLSFVTDTYLTRKFSGAPS